MALNRRQFLVSSMATIGAASSHLIGCSIGGGGGSTGCGYEGIYTDKFTYRLGEIISVYASLISSAPVNITIERIDIAPSVTVGTYTVQLTDDGNTNQPGETGALFDAALELNASDFSPGLYRISLPSSMLETANQVDGIGLETSVDPSFASGHDTDTPTTGDRARTIRMVPLQPTQRGGGVS